MLTKRQNFLQTIHGGKPDRFVNSYEFLNLFYAIDPITGAAPPFPPIGGESKSLWGVTVRWVEGQPGPMPLHDDAHKVVKDITTWRDVVHAPKTHYPASDWEDGIKKVEAIDRNEQYACLCFFTGVFEQLHYLQGITESLINFYEYPKETHELIDYITEYELAYAEEVTKYLKPDALFHHDDWGSYTTLLLSPDMFREFILPAYKKIYGYYKSHGVEIVVHHCDSYAAPLVPHMIEAGIDVFQGCTSTNNVPKLVKEYGGKISFMGDLDSGILDRPDWSRERIRKEVERACRSNGKHYFIPCLVQGLDLSTFPGVYEAVTEEIDRMSKELF
ncbi:MAG: uroporphyrinogen decarboxylase [Treponema sp.]|nr:uroporphyrinogen decarboxylase [Treponema sp.]